MESSGSISHQPPQPDPSLGVFETLLVVDGAPLELDGHLARLGASLRELYGRPGPEDVRELVAAHARPLALGRLRLTVAPAEGDRLAAEVTTAAVGRGYVLPGWSAPLTLAPAVVAGWRGAHKWADRRLLEALETQAAPAMPLLVDADGAALETSRANVFAVIGGALVTPPLDGRILPGVTRARAFELARAAGLEVVERPLELGELLRADELFTTGAIRGIAPVAACEPGGRWRPGPVTPRLATALGRSWRFLTGEPPEAGLP